MRDFLHEEMARVTDFFRRLACLLLGCRWGEWMPDAAHPYLHQCLRCQRIETKDMAPLVVHDITVETTEGEP